MGPAAYIIAILGCGDDELSCREMRLVEARYASATACQAAADAALIAAADLDFPVLRAECRSAPATRMASAGGPR